MKLTVFFILISVVTVMAGKTYSQTKTLTLKMEQVSLKEALAEIENQSEFRIMYSGKFIDVDRKVSVSVNDKKIETVLNLLFAETDVGYTIRDKFIVLTTPESINYGSFALFQQHTVSGKVTDLAGQPLPGVSIVIKGTTQGTVTDVNGSYSLSNISADAILVFSFVGMRTQEVAVGNQLNVNIEMLEDIIGLEEVVAVGYGTQKKANLTGAVDQVGSEVFENRPMPNVTQGLQGAIPNLNIQLVDGKPARSTDFQIRGLGSIGQGGSALILIDGVEGDPAMLNPNDIESISVLKDASSSAIYGARGAFGVVLVTTKSPGKERTSVTYSGNVIMGKPTRIPDMVSDGYLEATMFQEAYSSYYDYSRTPTVFHRANPFSEKWLEEMSKRRPGSGKPEVEVDANGNYVYYANTDWFNELFKSQTMGNNHNLTIEGSTEKVGFYASGRFYEQGGLYRYNSDDYSMYTVRVKGFAHIFDWLEVNNNMNLSNMDYSYPHPIDDGNIWYRIQNEGQAMAPVFNPDGTLTMAGAYSVGDLWYGKNGMNNNKSILRNTTSFTTRFFDDALRVKGDLTFRNTNNYDNFRRVPVPYSNRVGEISYLGASTNDFSSTNEKTKYLATNIYGEYEKTFSIRHYFKGMLGYNYEQSEYESLTTRRNGLAYPDADNLNLATGGNIFLNSGYDKWRIAGGFFRLNYSFDDRYLFEVNGRMDGSSKFPSGEQWAFFPSVSAGWRISQEPFWNVSESVISNLKLRASYGSLGNGSIRSYAFMELFKISQMTRLVNGQLNQMTSQPGVVPDGLTWETSNTLDFGLDLELMNGKMLFTGDIYNRKTLDMFAAGMDLPEVFGASPPKGNYADMTTKGWELSLNWRDDFSLGNRPFKYNVRITLADYVSKIDKFTNPEKEIGGYADARLNYYEGMTLGEIWGYVTEGFFTSQADVENHADQSLYNASATGKWLPGDIKFKDLNGDGVIDYGTNKIGDMGDRKIIGNSTPRYSYSLNLGADWNNLFLSAFFQGIGKQDWWPGTDNGLFWGQYNRPYGMIPSTMIGDIWTEENPDTYFPRYRGYVALQAKRELAVVQTRYLQSVAYIRLKNLQVGYHLPKSVSSMLMMDRASIYLSAENLWAWSPLYKRTKNFDVGNIYGEDREAEAIDAAGGQNSLITNGGQTYNYPIQSSFSLGLTVTF